MQVVKQLELEYVRYFVQVRYLGDSIFSRWRTSVSRTYTGGNSSIHGESSRDSTGG